MPINNVNVKFALGCLNSRLTYWYFKNLYNEFDSLFPQIKTNEFKSLPIAKCGNQEQLIIENLVDKILVTKAKDPKADTSKLEREIDEMVYALYGLTDDEIAIVEGK